MLFACYCAIGSFFNLREREKGGKKNHSAPCLSYEGFLGAAKNTKKAINTQEWKKHWGGWKSQYLSKCHPSQVGIIGAQIFLTKYNFLTQISTSLVPGGFGCGICPLEKFATNKIVVVCKKRQRRRRRSETKQGGIKVSHNKCNSITIITQRLIIE